jgi:hypothetical protein
LHSNIVYLQGQAFIFTNRLAFLPAKENSKTYLINYSHTRKSIKFLSRKKTRKPLHPQKKSSFVYFGQQKKSLKKKQQQQQQKSHYFILFIIPMYFFPFSQT